VILEQQRNVVATLEPKRTEQLRALIGRCLQLSERYRHPVVGHDVGHLVGRGLCNDSRMHDSNSL
jgi:hypothetical protein